MAGLHETSIGDALAKYWPWIVGFFAILFLSLFATVYVARVNGQIREMSRELAINEDIYRRMFEKHSSVKLLIHAETGKIADANLAAVDFYGYSRDELIGKPIREINTMPPEKVKAELKAVKEGRKSHLYFQHKLASGEIRHVEVHSGPIVIGDDDMVHSIIHDVTDRVLAEEELRRSEETVRSVFDQVSDVVWSLNWPDLSVNYISPSCQDVFGYGVQDFENNPTLWKDIAVFEDKPGIEVAMKQLIEDGHALREYRAVRSDGKIVWIRDKSQVIVDDNNNVIRIDGISSDITDLKEREKTLLALERQEQETRRHSSLMTLAAAIAHNFNNNLHVVIGHLEMMKSAHGTRIPIEENIEEAHKAAKVAAQNSQLMLLYVGQGQDFVLCDLGHILAARQEKLQETFPEGIHLKTDIAPNEEFIIKGDSERIGIAIANVITNAVESMSGKSGAIELRVVRSMLSAEALAESRIHFIPSPGEFICVEITDKGAGMEAETFERMFEPFFSTRFMGRGTGLAAVYGIVLGHEGAIFVDTSELIGTTVTLCFPIVKTDEN